MDIDFKIIFLNLPVDQSSKLTGTGNTDVDLVKGSVLANVVPAVLTQNTQTITGSGDGSGGITNTVVKAQDGKLWKKGSNSGINLPFSLVDLSDTFEGDDNTKVNLLKAAPGILAPLGILTQSQQVAPDGTIEDVRINSQKGKLYSD